MIELVALDIAGTTVDEGGAVYRVLAEVVAEHGTPASDADIRRFMGADKRAALVALTGDAGAAEVLHARFVERLRAAYAATPPRPVRGVPQAMATLRAAGVRVALTTGFDRQVTDPLLAALGWRVASAGCEGQLDAVVCAPEVAAGRPEPYMIHRAMELTGVTDRRASSPRATPCSTSGPGTPPAPGSSSPCCPGRRRAPSWSPSTPRTSSTTWARCPS